MRHKGLSHTVSALILFVVVIAIALCVVFWMRNLTYSFMENPLNPNNPSSGSGSLILENVEFKTFETNTSKWFRVFVSVTTLEDITLISYEVLLSKNSVINGVFSEPIVLSNGQSIILELICKSYEGRKYVITLSIESSISGLVSINHPLGSKQTVILTFFGDQYGVWDDAMVPYLGAKNRGMLNYPFRVIVQFPRENYLSSDTFPSPVELFVTERFRSTMFDLNFSYPEGYAQSISCSYINPQNESNRGFFTFLSGVAITTGITICVELYLQSSREKRRKGEKTISHEQKQDEEEETEESYDETILRLIQLVDHNKSKLFKSLDFLRGGSTFAFVMLWVLLGLIEVILFFGDASLTDKITMALSFLAFAVAFLSLSAYFAEASIVEVNFKRLEKCVRENQKPLLKALIKIKAKHTEFDLKQIYSMNASMFTKEKLLEKLYD